MENKKAFAERIKKLKTLRVKDKEKFSVLLEDTKKEFDVSQATIYRHLLKKAPGVRKTRTDAGTEKKPVSKKMAAVVTELQLAGLKKGEAIKKAVEITGETLSAQKAVGIEEGTKTEKTNFGSAAKEFIRKILDLDLTAPEAGLYFKYRDVAFKVRKDYIEDIALILATAYNESIEGNADGKLIIDREQKLKSQLYHFIQEALRVASERLDFDVISGLTSAYKRLKDAEKDLSTDFTVFEKAMKELRPEITRSECIALVKKFS